jgi:hypothetical protein
VKRREFAKSDKAAMLLRSRDASGIIRCEGCGMDLTGKHFEFDHVIAEGLVVDKTKPLTIADGKLLGRDCCHRAPGGKTAQDVAVIAKAKRREAIHTGAKIRGKGFPPAKRDGRASRPLERPLPPRRGISA